MPELKWFKSSFSPPDAPAHACVEVAHRADGVSLRHSDRPDGGVLEYTDAEFNAFLEGAKAGEFDRP